MLHGTLIVTESATPLQVSVKVVVAVNGPVDSILPEVGSFVPAHPPDAVQDVALVVYHVRVVARPESSAYTAATRSTVAGADVTVRGVFTVVVPPAPVQARV